MESELGKFIPCYDEFDEETRKRLEREVVIMNASRGGIVYRAGEECLGTVIVMSGQLRAFTSFNEGREISLYRLFAYDMCLFSASCMFNMSAVSISLMAEEETRYMIIPTALFTLLQDSSPRFASIVSKVMMERFSDVYSLLDQVLNRRINTRLAALLLEEADLASRDTLETTQEKLASHLGSAREVVTRTLKYLQEEGLIEVGRGSVRILDRKGLEEMAGL